MISIIHALTNVREGVRGEGAGQGPHTSPTGQCSRAEPDRTLQLSGFRTGCSLCQEFPSFPSLPVWMEATYILKQEA